MRYLAFTYCRSMTMATESAIVRVSRTPFLVDIRGAALDPDLKENWLSIQFQDGRSLHTLMCKFPLFAA